MLGRPRPPGGGIVRARYVAVGSHVAPTGDDDANCIAVDHAHCRRWFSLNYTGRRGSRVMETRTIPTMIRLFPLGSHRQAGCYNDFADVLCWNWCFSEHFAKPLCRNGKAAPRGRKRLTWRRSAGQAADAVSIRAMPVITPSIGCAGSGVGIPGMPPSRGRIPTASKLYTPRPEPKMGSPLWPGPRAGPRVIAGRDINAGLAARYCRALNDLARAEPTRCCSPPASCAGVGSPVTHGSVRRRWSSCRLWLERWSGCRAFAANITRTRCASFGSSRATHVFPIPKRLYGAAQIGVGGVGMRSPAVVRKTRAAGRVRRRSTALASAVSRACGSGPIGRRETERPPDVSGGR